ncbi:hypothetical protein AMAG_05898 [Allomyces macrogynus ATCC 38327]|uniref:Uncharacterized protein n=1 Tax=Allomyces macrogynus (strain ATCC 38327) TaxID=578462 RepID=A0A0L0SDL2_ALLM3|nr:hypothetical protein AMAG_05898 [Allomyces macrogynus ATCC 38327]|eukprot:KNE60514.1 hypothetical protein AMAG_05898 [Allomyces macrogynus ATCC 38327]
MSTSTPSSLPSFIDPLAAAIPTSAGTITSPFYGILASTRRSGGSSAHPLALSHVLADDGTVFLIAYASRTAPILNDLKHTNVVELAIQTPGGIWRVDGKSSIACAPSLLMRFPPPRVHQEEDPRLYWERHRLSVFMRLSAKQRALYLLPPAYESVRHAKEIVAEVPTPEGETVDALAERLFGVMSLTSSVLSANSSPAAGPATAPVALPATKQSNFEFALEEFVLVVIKLTKVDLLEYGSEVADFQRLVWTLNKDGSWRSAETVSP